MKKQVTKEFYEAIREEFPNIIYPPHRELLMRAFFSHCICNESGAVRFSAPEIAKCFGVEYSKAFNAGNKLKEFLALLPVGTATLLLVNGKEWVHGQYENLGPQDVLNEDTGLVETKNVFKKLGDGFERRVQFNWSDKVRDLINIELNDKSKDKVYFVSGLKKNVAQERLFLRTTIEEASNKIELLDVEAAKEIAEYMNNLPVNSFNKLIENSEIAMKAINEIESPIVRDQQIRILNSILESPKPVYVPSKNGKTDRLFGIGANLTNLKSTVRQQLTQWDECDIRSCHLAVAGWLWGVDSLNQFLASGKSFWDEILPFMGLTKASKGTVKNFLYGLIYGMSKKNLTDGIDSSFPGVVRAGERFLSHPIVKDLLNARTAVYKQAKALGCINDAFGKAHKVTSANLTSVMARVSQSYEMVLLKPIFDLAKTTDDFTIQLYQLDGLSIVWNRKAHKDYWIERLNRTFKENADNLGILTNLDWKFVTVQSDEKVEEVKEIVEEAITFLPEQKAIVENNLWNGFIDFIPTSLNLLDKLVGVPCLS